MWNKLAQEVEGKDVKILDGELKEQLEMSGDDDSDKEEKFFQLFMNL